MLKLKYLKGATFVLKCCLLYPIDKENSQLKKNLYLIWGFFFILSFITADIQCIVYLIQQPFDLVAEGMVIMNAAIYVTLFVNFFLFHYNSDKLMNLVKNINDNFSDESDIEIEKISMRPTSLLADKFAYMWTLSVVVSGIFTGMVTLILGNRNAMPIPGWFPYDFTKSPQYEFTSLWQMYCQINLGLIYGASDSIFPSLTLIIGQQFQISASNITNSFYSAALKSGIPKETLTKFLEDSKIHSLIFLMEKYQEIFILTENETFQKSIINYLKKSILHHKTLINYCQDLNDIMSPYLMIKMLITSFNTIFIVFAITTAEDQSTVIGLSNYVVFGTLELLICNYGGQILIQDSDILSKIYDSPWYLCSLRFQKIFLILQQRMGQIVSVKAGNYFEMSAPTFISFIKCVFSYAAVLKEVTKVEK